MTHLLDTDHLTNLQRKDGREWATIVRHVRVVGELEVGVSVVSFHEQVIGLHAKLNAAKSGEELIRWYRKLGDLLDSFASMNLVPFDPPAAAILDVIRKAPKVRTKPMDLRIAAIALAHDLTLVTRNTRDFELVPRLKLEDWTK